MNRTMGSMTSAPRLSSGRSPLEAGIHCDRATDTDGMPVEVYHGEGRDEGTVTLQIGDACVWFSSTADLIAMLTEKQDGHVGIAVVG